MEGWRGKSAIINGANSELGIAIARMLLRERVNVIGVDIECSLLQELENIENFSFIQADLSNEEDIWEVFLSIEESHGGVDILINNIAFKNDCSLLNHDKSDWENSMNKSILKFCATSREAVRSMLERNIEAAHIINILDIFGCKIPKHSSLNLYSVTKQMLSRLTTHLRQELLVHDSFFKVSSLTLQTFSADNKEVQLQSDFLAESLKFILDTPWHVQVNDVCVQPFDVEV